MGVSFYRIKKWFRMITGRSILHVDQGVGSQFIPGELKGYYNDLTEKVTKDEAHISDVAYIPEFKTELGDTVEFAITIIQYGLGCYDMYIKTGDSVFLDKFITCAQWARNHQSDDGAIDAFSSIYPDAPYSAMCQGECASLFLRAHAVLSDRSYFDRAEKALAFMLAEKDSGGLCDYTDGLVLKEYTHLPVVMNGWIFAMFGIYDMSLVSDDERYGELFRSSVEALARALPSYDNGYWSMYDAGGKIASPFYHDLHIAQMNALFAVSGNPVFKEYGDRFLKYRKSFFKRSRAFIKKAIQKIFE